MARYASGSAIKRAAPKAIIDRWSAEWLKPQRASTKLSRWLTVRHTRATTNPGAVQSGEVFDPEQIGKNRHQRPLRELNAKSPDQVQDDIRSFNSPRDVGPSCTTALWGCARDWLTNQRSALSALDAGTNPFRHGPFSSLRRHHRAAVSLSHGVPPRGTGFRATFGPSPLGLVRRPVRRERPVDQIGRAHV